MPKTAVEIGCGRTPYAALRFLAEGGEQFVANDIQPVHAHFSNDLIDALIKVCEAVRPDLAHRLNNMFDKSAGCSKVLGLDIYGETPFEQLPINRNIGLIFSTSALEHVMDPIAVARKMSEVISTNGLMVHSIDFRDHRNFDEPFAFYKLSENEYSPIASENRLRPSDWIKLLDAVGFEIVERRDYALTAESIAAGHGYANGTYKFYQTGEMIPPSTTEAERRTFEEPFRHKDLVDLSIGCTQILSRKTLGTATSSIACASTSLPCHKSLNYKIDIAILFYIRFCGWNIKTCYRKILRRHSFGSELVADVRRCRFLHFAGKFRVAK